MQTVVLATRNQGKVADFRVILHQAFGPGMLDVVGLETVPDAPEVAEDGATFEHNATLKARTIAVHVGLPAVADDSGLVVDMLKGAPGVLSARWCGRHGDDRANLELLLAQMSEVPDEHRAAHFACCAAFALPSGEVHTRNGVFRGTLTREPRGHGGFGYDPIFRVEGDTRTSAEMTIEEKNALSHRGQALRALVPVMAQALGLPPHHQRSEST